MLFDLFQSFRAEARLADVARSAAARVRHAVWQRVSQRVPGLGANETRGYIRARAAGLVRSEVDAVMARDSLALRHRSLLIELTSDELVRQIVAHAAAANVKAARLSPARVSVPLRRVA